MIVHPTPGKKYTIEQLHRWFDEARSKGEELVLSPCNPWEPLLLQSKATANTMDDVAVITQWVGGLPTESEN